jgi:hypothetical protein
VLPRPILTVLAALAAFLLALPALADGTAPTPEEIAAARPLARDGLQLARAGNCAEAIPKLQRARELYEAPVVPAVALGQCLIEAGKLVAGTEILQVVKRQNLGPNAEKLNVDAKARAVKLLDQAVPRIGSLTINLSPQPDADVTVTIDGQLVSKSLLGIPRPTDPGDHTVEASGPGFQPTARAVTLLDGQARSITLLMTPASSGPVVAPVVAPKHARSSPVPGGILVGVGGAGLIVSGVTGLLALSKLTAVKNECPQNACPPSAAGDVSTLKTLSWVSTISLAAGVVSLGAGVTLLVVGRSSDKPGADKPKASLRITPGVGSVLASGEF